MPIDDRIYPVIPDPHQFPDVGGDVVVTVMWCGADIESKVVAVVVINNFKLCSLEAKIR